MSSKGYSRKRPSTSLSSARATSPPFSRAAARCAMFPGSILESPIEILDDFSTQTSSPKRRKVESRPASEWKPSGHKDISSAYRKEQRVLVQKEADKNVPSVATKLQTQKPRVEQKAPAQVKKSTRSDDTYPSDADQRKFDALIKQIQVQNLTIKDLGTKMDKILSSTQSDISQLLHRVRDQELEAKKERNTLLDQIRLVMAELLWMSIRRTTGIDFESPPVVPLPLTTDNPADAPVFYQPPVPPNVSGPAVHPIPTFPTADLQGLLDSNQWTVDPNYPASIPMQHIPREQSNSYTSEADWHSAKDVPSDPGTQFPMADEHLSLFLSQLVDDPTYSGYPSILNENQLRAYPKRRPLEGYWQTSADGINSYLLPQPPQVPALPSFLNNSASLSTLSNRSLSSGIESLPTGYTRETSVAATDAPSTSRSLRIRTKKPDYVGHPMDAMKKSGQTTATVEATERGDKNSDLDDGRHIRGRSACLPELILKASKGLKTGTGAIWPAHGRNTYGGRKCDHCKGRAHVACAGFDDQAELQRLPWSCPECTLILNSAEGETAPPIIQSQQERCLRPTCIVRTRKKLERRHRDEDEFYIERIVGRMRMTPAGRAKHQYEYLVKWTDYPIYESTWEPATNIKDLEYYKGHFISQANLEHVDLNRRVVMLKVTEDYWNDKGVRDEESLEREGVEKKEWWY